eukprot:4663314-Prymnesium_polylepis.1
MPPRSPCLTRVVAALAVARTGALSRGAVAAKAETARNAAARLPSAAPPTRGSAIDERSVRSIVASVGGARGRSAPPTD